MQAPVRNSGAVSPICLAVWIVGVQPLSAVSAMTASGLAARALESSAEKSS